MQVLSLSRSTSLETRLLRRELLALLEVREFSDEGRFQNPSASLKFPQLICNYCTRTRDLDLCRDGYILPEDDTKGSRNSTQAWSCPSCHAEYDRLALEERLVGQVQGLVVEWQSQDLKCEKCGNIKISELMEHCSCSGNWTATVDRGRIEMKLNVLHSVAEFYGLKMLTGVTGAVLAQM
jgi:DNA polymerase epsilon subunit 1